MTIARNEILQANVITAEDGHRALDNAQQSLALFATSGIDVSLRSLIGENSPSAALAVCLHRIAVACGSSASFLERTTLLLVASCHSLRHWRYFKRPPFSDAKDVCARPVDWLLLAGSTACAAEGKEQIAIARLVQALHSHVAAPPPYLFAETSPFLSYSAADLLSLACSTDTARVAGDALGRLTRLTEEMAAIHCDAAANLGKAEPHLLSHIASAAGVPEAELRAAWARAAAPIPERMPIRALLGRRSVLDQVHAHVECWIQQAITGLPNAMAREHVMALVHTCHRILQRALSAARMAITLPVIVQEGELAEPARTIRMARAALASDPGYHEAVETQRWGCWANEPRLGRLFPIGLCLSLRGAVGDDVSAEVDDLLSRRRADGWRYYEDYCGGLPGIDDLALVLQLFPYAGDHDTLRRALARPMEQLVRHTSPEGAIATWFECDLIEPPDTTVPDWCRSHCMGVALRVLDGLVSSRMPLPEGYFNRALDYALRWYARVGDASIAFYPASYIQFQLAALYRKMEGFSVDAALRTQLKEILDKLVHEIKTSQRANGSWGSPMTTALRLATLVLVGTENSAREAALVYLQTQQEPDGLWPKEPIFGTIGKDSAPYNYGSRSVTTAFCLYAVFLASGELRQ